MAKTWGNQNHQVGFYEYGTSPFHMKLFKGFFFPGIFNFTTRFAKNMMFVLPPMYAFYQLHCWADKKFEYYNRKEYLYSKEGKAAAGH